MTCHCCHAITPLLLIFFAAAAAYADSPLLFRHRHCHYYWLIIDFHYFTLPYSPLTLFSPAFIISLISPPLRRRAERFAAAILIISLFFFFFALLFSYFHAAAAIFAIRFDAFH